MELKIISCWSSLWLEYLEIIIFPKRTFRPVIGLRNRRSLKVLNDSRLIQRESGWPPWSFRLNHLEPFYLPFVKQITCRELLFGSTVNNTGSNGSFSRALVLFCPAAKFVCLPAALEAVCCKKRQKIVHDQLLVWGVGDLWRTWRIPNWF